MKLTHLWRQHVVYRDVDIQVTIPADGPIASHYTERIVFGRYWRNKNAQRAARRLTVLHPFLAGGFNVWKRKYLTPLEGPIL